MYLLNISVINEDNNFVIPQVLNMGLDYDWDGKDSVSNIPNAQPLGYRPNLESMVLDPQTKATDIVSQGYIYSNGLLVSERMKSFLDSFNIQPHQSFPANVIDYDQVLPYFWLQMIGEVEDSLNYSQCKFHSLDTSTGVQQSQLINDKSQLRETSQRLSEAIGLELVADQLTFNSGSQHYDLFFIRLTGKKIYISNDLAQALEYSGMTGFRIDSVGTAVTSLV